MLISDCSLAVCFSVLLPTALEIFPGPFASFAFPGMIVDFPKANFFMTTWGMRKYWVGQEESFVDVRARETVPLLVLNQELLDRNQMESAPARELIEIGRAHV